MKIPSDLDRSEGFAQSLRQKEICPPAPPLPLPLPLLLLPPLPPLALALVPDWALLALKMAPPFPPLPLPLPALLLPPLPPLALNEKAALCLPPANAGASKAVKAMAAVMTAAMIFMDMTISSGLRGVRRVRPGSCCLRRLQGSLPLAGSPCGSHPIGAVSRVTGPKNLRPKNLRFRRANLSPANQRIWARRSKAKHANGGAGASEAAEAGCDRAVERRFGGRGRDAVGNLDHGNVSRAHLRRFPAAPERASLHQSGD